MRRRAERHHAMVGRPCVTLCYAQSLNGSIARPDGAPLRISGEAASMYTHALRAAHDAILVGVGTVLSDDPRLTTRLVTGASPRPVVLDSRLRTPPTARLLATPALAAVVATTPACGAEAEKLLLAAGAQVVRLPATPSAKVDLAALLAYLGDLGVHSLMIEGGSQVIDSFLREQLVDHLVVTISMQYLDGKPVLPPGTGRPMETGAAPYPRLVPEHMFWAGPDLVLHGDPVWS